MKEYIEREKLIDDILHALLVVPSEDFLLPPEKDIVRMIKSEPAADVREVVTCGECKHWFENGSDFCSCDRDALLRERGFFCAAGEKREES